MLEHLSPSKNPLDAWTARTIGCSDPLQLRAELRGFKLPVDVGRFLLNRLSRDMRTLLTTLDELDNASLDAKRKLTIPFVKEALHL